MKKILLMGVAALMLAACQNDDVTTANKTAETGNVHATVADWQADGETRTALTLDLPNNIMRFTWSEGDFIRIYNKDVSSELMLKDVTGGLGTSDGILTGESNPLVPEHQYRAVYSSNDKAKWDLTYDYLNQTQSANDNYDHLAAKDVLVSAITTPTSENNARFAMDHMGHIIILKMAVDAGTYNAVTITADNNSTAFTTSASLDLWGETLVKPTAQTGTVTLNLNNVAIANSGDTLTAYIMISPTNLRNNTLTITAKGADGTSDQVFTEVAGRNFRQGRASIYRLPVEDNSPYVDLGLPSGNLWASCNIGASKPVEYGDYYGFGEKVANKTSTSISDYKAYYLMWDIIDNYQATIRGKWFNFQDDDFALTYPLGVKTGGGVNWNTNSTLNVNYDTSKQVWGETNAPSGKHWVTPLQSDWLELLGDASSDEEYTYVVWTERNGVHGVRVTSKKNGKSIFLPAAGYWSPAAATHYLQGTNLRYWAAEFKANVEDGTRAVGYGAALNYSEDENENQGFANQAYYFGLSVRPIIKGTTTTTTE